MEEDRDNRFVSGIKRVLAFPMAMIGKLLHMSMWLILLGVLVGLIVWRVGMPKLSAWFGIGKTAVAEFVSPEKALINDRGRVNIALLGFGGDGHEGGELADSIQIFSLSVFTNDAILFAIPRDIWIPELKAKINKAPAIGEENNEGNAVIKRSISDVIGMPVHYVVKVDFDGFIKLIDYVGGVEVQVEKGFIDKKYPIKGKENDPVEANRYETLTFTPGRQQMNGATTLKFVRSRHAEGQEGSDLARSRRQQLILKAVKDKLLNSQMLLDKSKLNDLIGIANQYIKTDVDLSKIGAWMRMAFIHRDAQIKTIEIPTYIDAKQSTNTYKDALLYHPGLSGIYKGEWVFVPKNNSFEEIHVYMNCKVYNYCL